jgi:hypothetical protein
MGRRDCKSKGLPQRTGCIRLSLVCRFNTVEQRPFVTGRLVQPIAFFYPKSLRQLP